MLERLENAALIALESLMAVVGLAFALFIIVVVPALFGHIGFIALRAVGLI